MMKKLALGRPARILPFETRAGHTIERRGVLKGRWPHYDLIVDGVFVGAVKRSLSQQDMGGATKVYRPADAWVIHGMTAETQKSAEQELLRRAINFGHIKWHCLNML